MGNIFSKFFMSIGFKKDKYLPAGNDEPASTLAAVSAQNTANYITQPTIETVTTAGKSIKTLASFDLNIEKPKYYGAIPEATIKFYPLD